MFKNKVNDLVERLIYDASDRDGSNSGSRGLYRYLQDVHTDFTNDAAIGSAKQAIAQGISTLSEKQLRAIAIDMLNDKVYMESCPNSSCDETIAWEDMRESLWEGQCYHCCSLEERW